METLNLTRILTPAAPAERPSLFRRVFGIIVAGLLGHRISIAFALFLGTWLFGGVGLFVIGQIFGGATQYLDTSGTHPNNWSLLNCLFMSAITMSTVGYGDYVDVHSLSADGRQTAITFLIFFNLSCYVVLLYVSGTILSFLVEGTLSKFFKRRRMEQLLHDSHDHFIVCGCGTTGTHIVDELSKVGKRVVVIDPHAESLQHALKHHANLLTIQGDALDDEVLREAGVARAGGLFATLHEDKDNIVLTLSARQINPTIRIVARATQFENIAKFRRVGASAVISPNHIGGLRMASEMVRPQVVSFLDTMLRDQSSVMRFENVPVRAGGKAAGKKLVELSIPSQLGLAVIGIVRTGGGVEYNPNAETRLNSGDAVIVVTDPERQKKLDQLLN